MIKNIYKLVKEPTSHKLEMAVESHLNNGYKLSGSLIYIDGWFIQPMTNEYDDTAEREMQEYMKRNGLE